MRRFAVLLIAMSLGGCPDPQGGQCEADTDCGDQVCARDGQCHDANKVRPVTVTWTINGMPPDATLCSGNDLYVEFDGIYDGETVGFEPVPCPIGRFFVDKLPYDYVSIEVGPIGRGLSKVAPIDSQDAASVDLRF